jgi:hypothetical protein
MRRRSSVSTIASEPSNRGRTATSLVLSGPLADPRARILLVVVEGRVAYRAPKE